MTILPLRLLLHRERALEEPAIDPPSLGEYCYRRNGPLYFKEHSELSCSVLMSERLESRNVVRKVPPPSSLCPYPPLDTRFLEDSLPDY